MFSPRVLVVSASIVLLIIGNEVIAPYFMTQQAVTIETSNSIVGGFPYLVDTSFGSRAFQIRKWVWRGLRAEDDTPTDRVTKIFREMSKTMRKLNNANF